LKVLIEKIGGKSIPELVALGSTKFASMPSGGASSSASAAPVQAAAAKVEEKKEAPKEEEVDVDMGDLFGY
jgi:large subunit ribosomal protein LP2